MKIKKRLIFLSALLSFVIFGIWFYYFLIPRNEIKHLAKGYVQSKVNAQNKANYKVVNKKPYKWVPLNKINKKAYQAIMISEDSSFYKHGGVDLGQIKEAVKEKIKGKRLRGASTISQQVVKNLFLTPDKNIWRKVKEMGFSFYLEKNVDKKKILELYLNIIEYGPGIYGINAASKYYFNKKPDQLTAKEGAFLAMLLPNPKKNGESFKKGKLTPYAKKTMGSIIKKMKSAKFIDSDDENKAIQSKFDWEKPPIVDDYEALGKGDSRDEPAYKTMHEKLREEFKIKIKKKAKLNKKHINGGKFKKRFRDDIDIEIREDPDYDPDALIEDISGLEEEFKID